MTWKSTTTQPKPRTRSAQHWTPRVYQEKAVDFLASNGSAALFADPGTGKTAATLAAFLALKQAGVARTALVIAPRRVCQLVWWQESRKWAQFNGLTFAWLHDSRAPWDIDGSARRKEKEIEKPADIYLINPEGVQWLYKRFYDHRAKRATLPFDTVVVDELTKFKNAQSQRSKHLRALTSTTPRIWGLTGTPTPNGYEDLFGQMLLLDGGNALGRFITYFRDKYFVPDGYTGFKYKLAEGAAARIEERIAPLALRISAEDWLDLPRLIDNPIKIALDAEARAAYKTMAKEMLLETAGGVVTAANSAALYAKLSQLANGALYLESAPGEKRGVQVIHDAKLEALDDLIDQLAGQPLLLAYEFNHDLARLQEWWRAKTGQELPYLGAGVTDREVAEIERRWNNNELTLLAAHPQSAGHGLNLQGGGARHVCWFSATWNLELYDQFIRRVLRQGNDSAHVMNHLLLVEDSIDELKYAALADKDETQARFLQALNTAFGSPGAGQSAPQQQENDEMAFEKLKLKAAAAAPAQQVSAPAEPTVPAARQWGKPAAAEAATPATQREQIRAKITGEDAPQAPVDAVAAFPKDIQAALAGGETVEAVAEKPKATRKRAAKTLEEDMVDAAVSTIQTNYRSINITIELTFDSDGNPVPKVSVSAGLSGDFEEDAAVRVGELAAAAAEATTNKLLGGE